MDPQGKVEFRTISYSKVLASNASEISTLRAAAIEEGVFYLDLAQNSEFGILQDVSDLFSASKVLFDLPMSEKMLYDTNKLGTMKNYGYKPIGRNAGLTQEKRDGHELFLTPCDVVLGINHCRPLDGPAILLRNVKLLEQFAEESHRIGLSIMKVLELSTGLEGLVDSHRVDCSSTSAIALLKYPPLEESNYAGHIPHTDVGSLTILFCQQNGLQAMHPASGRWENVTPRPGHAIVNIGDSLHHLSNRAFTSAYHRVLPHTTINHDARYSIIYFMRPEQTAMFTDESGKEWKSVDWHNRKFDAFRTDNPAKVQHILDGRV